MLGYSREQNTQSPCCTQKLNKFTANIGEKVCSNKRTATTTTKDPDIINLIILQYHRLMSF